MRAIEDAERAARDAFDLAAADADERLADADPDVFTFLAEGPPEFDWLIPGLLERGDRLILTGGEGYGKSTLLRQLAVCAAAGEHPFSSDPIPPRRVLLVDLENPRRLVQRQLGPLIAKVSHQLARGRLIPVLRPEGCDLHTDSDRAWFAERIERNEPDLVLVGPLYKMLEGSPTEEEPARAAAGFLDELRARHGFALVIEAHVPHRQAGGPQPQRPYGASLWRRWPELGLYLAPDGTLTPWRGARDERDWPTMLRRGGVWPWTPHDDDRDEQVEDVIRTLIREDPSPGVRAVRRAVRDAGISAAHVRVDEIRARLLGDDE